MSSPSQRIPKTESLILSLDQETDISLTFRPIPACPEGFRMGSRGYRLDEEPIHRVVISEPFWMAETPVTQAQLAVWTASSDYKQWFEDNKDKLDDGAKHHQNYFTEGDSSVLPAEQISWHEATGFCEWLTRQNTEGKTAALPTEAQWEYACRGGTDTEYWIGDGEAAMAEVGWYEENSKKQTHPVKSKTALDHPFGLFDMHGSVWEWCRDVFDPAVYPARPDGGSNPLSTSGKADIPYVYSAGARVMRPIADGEFQVSPDDAHVLDQIVATFGENDTWQQVIESIEGCKSAEGKWPSDQITLAGAVADFFETQIKGFENPDDPPRVLRGGSWDDSASHCRSAIRFGNWAGSRLWGLGFRVCLFPGPESQPDKQRPQADKQSA